MSDTHEESSNNGTMTPPALPGAQDAPESDAEPSSQATETPEESRDKADLVAFIPLVRPSTTGQPEPAVSVESLESLETADLQAILDHEQALVQIEKLHQELERARRDASELKDLALRKAADLENFKRRTQKQVDELTRYGVEKVLKEFLPVVDDLERAINHARTSREAGTESDKDENQFTTFIEGVALVLRKFEQCLERFGVKGFDSMGKMFNPQFHEALSQIETNEHPGGSIMVEFLRGYTIQDRLMRPALVAVARTPTPIEPPPAVPADETTPDAVDQPSAPAPEGGPEAEKGPSESDANPVTPEIDRDPSS